MLQVDQPKEPRNAKHKLYAFNRSIGMTPAEACRKAGGNVDFGHATKWERQKSVQAWVAYFRSLGQTEETLAAKRSLIEERLSLAAFGNVFDFAAFDDDGRSFSIDWRKVAASPYGVIIEGFKFDKDTGRLTDFERDNALQALAQLRDMHGFAAPKKISPTDPSGKNPASVYLISDKPMSEDDWEAHRASSAAA